MAGGWYKDGAVQDQIDASVEDAVQRARERMAAGEGLENCEDCGATIPEGRRRAIPGVRRCVRCQHEDDEADAQRNLVDRRGNKDSQLK